MESGSTALWQKQKRKTGSANSKARTSCNPTVSSLSVSIARSQTEAFAMRRLRPSGRRLRRNINQGKREIRRNTQKYAEMPKQRPLSKTPSKKNPKQKHLTSGGDVSDPNWVHRGFDFTINFIKPRLSVYHVPLYL